ncbi:signal peptidase I [Caldalkalibacillus salinus]|uniref:signal peptidase I n=1 Tax=Caldalkalibacillus salinus TaxID=2803787 RepID=UPI003019E044
MDGDNSHTSVEGNEDDEDDEKTRGKGKSETLEWFKALSIAVAIALGIRIFLFAPIVVDGTSMLPTLEDGEKILVNKVMYHLDEPQRGDILVFHAEHGKDWIKRVIGEPGDTVEVRDDQLYINGEPIEERYLEDKLLQTSGILTHDFQTTVPEGHIFVMGDNRQNSRDSRSIGAIPIDDVVGRADVVFWPFDAIRLVQ